MKNENLHTAISFFNSEVDKDNAKDGATVTVQQFETIGLQTHTQ